MLHKGDRVMVHATVYTKYISGMGRTEILRQVEQDKNGDGYPRNFVRVWATPWSGIVVGKTVLISGLHFMGSTNYSDYDPGVLKDRQYHKVWKVIPAENDRWIEPVCCLEENLEKLG